MNKQFIIMTILIIIAIGLFILPFFEYQDKIKSFYSGVKFSCKDKTVSSERFKSSSNLFFYNDETSFHVSDCIKINEIKE